MSEYLEIPQWQEAFHYRSFIDEGTDAVFPHWHREIEIIVGKKGLTKIGRGEEIISLEKGEILFFASGEPHYFLTSPKSERLVFQFDFSMFDNELLGLSLKNLTELFEGKKRYSRDWSKETGLYLRNLLEELFLANNQEDKLKTLGILYTWVADFKRLVPEIADGKETKKYSKQNYRHIIRLLDKVYDYVENNYVHKITLKEISDYIGFNEQYFSRFFKENTGTTFIEFLNQYRITKATFYLTQTNANMEEIAEKSGFSTTKNFQGTFKKMMGVSPLQYKKQA